MLINDDPVNTISLRSYAMDSLNHVEQAVGSQRFQQALAGVDESTMKVLRQE